MLPQMGGSPGLMIDLATAGFAVNLGVGVGAAHPLGPAFGENGLWALSASGRSRSWPPCRCSRCGWERLDK